MSILLLFHLFGCLPSPRNVFSDEPYKVQINIWVNIKMPKEITRQKGGIEIESDNNYWMTSAVAWPHDQHAHISETLVDIGPVQNEH